MAEQKDIVLIVDDDESVQTVLYKVIRSNGIEADLAASGEEALERTAKKRYDLILLDVNMGGMDGFEVVETLRSRDIGTPIIIVSGRKEDYDTLYGLDIGADDYITKPFNLITLGAKVKGNDYRSIDIGIMTAYLTAEATAQGLSTCILGWLDDGKIRKAIGTDAPTRLVITLGYAAEDDKLRTKKRKELGELVRSLG